MALLSALKLICSSVMHSLDLGFKPVQDDFQHNFARVTDEANSSVVLAHLSCQVLPPI